MRRHGKAGERARSVAALSEVVERLAAQCLWSASERASECGGKGTLRHISYPGSDFSHCQLSADQQFSAPLQAAESDEFHGCHARLADEARMKAWHGETGQARKIFYFQGMRQMAIDMSIKR